MPSDVPPEPAPSTDDARPLSDDEIARSAKDWELTQQQLGNLGVMAESNWALDWAERLLAEIRRLRDEDEVSTRHGR